MLKRIAFAVAIAVSASAVAQAPPAGPIVLVDATGKVAARPLSDTLVLVTIDGISAPASIGPIYGEDSRTASGIATWRSGGSVLFTSPDCTSGAQVFSSSNAGVRATSQVETPDGVMLFVGAIGTPATVAVKSILYGSGCSPVTVQQNGLVPVETKVNLTNAYPPPLSFQ
jgi:hypothetical protein